MMASSGRVRAVWRSACLQGSLPRDARPRLRPSMRAALALALALALRRAAGRSTVTAAPAATAIAAGPGTAADATPSRSARLGAARRGGSTGAGGGAASTQWRRDLRHGRRARRPNCERLARRPTACGPYGRRPRTSCAYRDRTLVPGGLDVVHRRRESGRPPALTTADI